MRKYVCSDLKIYTQPDTFRYRQVLICPMHNFLSPPSGGGYVSHRNFVAAAVKFGFLLLLFLLLFLVVFLLLTLLYPGASQGRALVGPVCENLHSPPRDIANLRKYALESSPVADCENMHSAKIILSPYSKLERKLPMTRADTPQCAPGQSAFRALEPSFGPHTAVL